MLDDEPGTVATAVTEGSGNEPNPTGTTMETMETMETTDRRRVGERETLRHPCSDSRRDRLVTRCPLVTRR